MEKKKFTGKVVSHIKPGQIYAKIAHIWRTNSDVVNESDAWWYNVNWKIIFAPRQSFLVAQFNVFIFGMSEL